MIPAGVLNRLQAREGDRLGRGQLGGRAWGAGLGQEKATIDKEKEGTQGDKKKRINTHREMGGGGQNAANRGTHSDMGVSIKMKNDKNMAFCYDLDVLLHFALHRKLD